MNEQLNSTANDLARDHSHNWWKTEHTVREFNKPFSIKPLNSEFSSFGEALFTWLNSDGYEERSSKMPDGVMVRAFVTALGQRVSHFDTENLTGQAMYFESEEWVFEWIEAHGFQNIREACWIKLDAFNRPIAILDMERNKSSENFTVDITGLDTLVKELWELALKNVKADPIVEQKTTYAEVVLGGFGMTTETGTINNPREANPAYYPYMDGGVIELIRDFIESDETVLVLKGKPGTGKSSAISAATTALDLLPIYAKRADVLAHPGLVDFIFKASDSYMTNVGGTEARARKDLFKPAVKLDQQFMYRTKFYKEEDNEERQRVPVIVVEDADLLLAPRSQGNTRMSELLNATDGIGSSHTRKIIFTTNLADDRDIDEALIRPGRCYDVVNFRLLTPAEAVAAREACGLPPFESLPLSDVSLAEALRKPRKKICMSNGRAALGFVNPAK